MPSPTTHSDLRLLVKLFGNLSSAMRFSLLPKSRCGGQVRPQTKEHRGPSVRSAGRSMKEHTVVWAQVVSQVSVGSQRADTAEEYPVYTRASKLETRWRGLVSVLYHWATCLFITGLVLSQLLGAVWDSRSTVEHLVYGRDPSLGPYQIVGSNDAPYADRVIACVRHGEFYEPRLVSSLLAAEGVEAILENESGTAVTGYRIVQRRAVSSTDMLDSAAKKIYRSSCTLIASTLDNILNSCSALGYNNLTRNDLYVVDNWDSDRLFRLPNTLPVLIMPFWDNAAYARHAVPTWGGDACVFRLRNAYSSSARDAEGQMAWMNGVSRSVRHERTIEWLGSPDGVWKNGWYEDLKGMRWYSSEAMSSETDPPFHIMERVFDTRSGLEVNCTSLSVCENIPRVDQWGEKFHTELLITNAITMLIANGTQFGYFMFDGDVVTTVVSVFDWETLLSNVSVGVVLVRWVCALVALQMDTIQSETQWFDGSIGCVSNTGSFAMLPLTTLPRLKMTLAAFWTVGCRFEGQQAGLSEAWFAIYPAITQLVLIYYSLLNLLAKVLRRRVSDALFPPTVAALCMLHYFRLELATSGWLSGVDSRVPTVVFSDEVQRLQLADYFTTDVAWRMNGRVELLFAVKLGILGMNLLPLVLARPFPVAERGVNLDLKGVEKALALRVRHVGGLGLSRMYIVASASLNQRKRVSTRSLGTAIVESNLKRSVASDDLHKYSEETTMTTQIQVPNDNDESSHEKINDYSTSSDNDKAVRPTSISASREPRQVLLVNSYELVRLGYIVFGGKYLITFDDWNLLSSMALFRSCYHLWNHRVIVWTLADARSEGDAEAAGGRVLEDVSPQMWRLDDPRLQSVRWWQISVCCIQC